MKPQSPVLGIEFGTTNLAGAYWDGKRIDVVRGPNTSGLLPSAFSWRNSSSEHTDGVFLIGEPALNEPPEQRIVAIKRLLGRSLSDPEVQEIKGHFPFHLVEAGNGGIAIELNGRTFSSLFFPLFFPERRIGWILKSKVLGRRRVTLDVRRTRSELMGDLSLYCVYCSAHTFKVDENTLEGVRIIVLKCPRCGKLTRVGLDGRTHELLVLPVGSESQAQDSEPRENENEGKLDERTDTNHT
jgi:hypothetical protein